MPYSWTLPLPLVGDIIEYSPTVTDMRNNVDWLDDNRACRTNDTTINGTEDTSVNPGYLAGDLGGNLGGNMIGNLGANT
jgi:hypothetical protein